MPIGNLTSQIFANIYMNEFDRFVKHNLKPKAYMRYGDDFIMIEKNFQKLSSLREQATDFLHSVLKLNINPKSDKILKSKQGLKFLGVVIWPSGRRLSKRNEVRVQEKLTLTNVASYRGVVTQHTSDKKIREFSWITLEKLLSEIL